MDINPSEITKILKEQIKNLEIKPKFLKSEKFFLLVMVSLEFMV